jgi:hypothetical protein
MLRHVVLVRTTRRNIPEDTILHSYRRENLKFYKTKFKFTFSQNYYNPTLLSPCVNYAAQNKYHGG